VEAGADDLIAKVTGGWADFDVAIAHPQLMGKVGKLGRILGPQGKMPSPKSGTVTPDVVNAVREYAAGKVEYRNDEGGNSQGQASLGEGAIHPEGSDQRHDDAVGPVRGCVSPGRVFDREP